MRIRSLVPYTYILQREDFATYKCKITRLSNSSSSHSLFSYLPHFSFSFILFPLYELSLCFPGPTPLFCILAKEFSIAGVFVITSFSTFCQSRDVWFTFRLPLSFTKMCLTSNVVVIPVTSLTAHMLPFLVTVYAVSVNFLSM